jgi:microcompartment protein CcmL/EutN
MGLIEVEGVAGIIVAADAACKAASVRLLGWESIGGFTTVFFVGEAGDVAISLRSGEQAAREIGDHVVTAALNRPDEVCATYIDFPLQGASPERETALGILETRGYGVHVDANDRMVKAADVEVSRVLTVHNRVVCTLIEGAVSSVGEALEAGRQCLGGYDHFLCATVISQPAAEVLHLFSDGS